MYAHNIIKYVALECWDVICSAALLAQFILYATTFLFFPPSCLSCVTAGIYTRQESSRLTETRRFPSFLFPPKGLRAARMS